MPQPITVVDAISSGYRFTADDPSNIAITGGTIDGTAIGQTTAGPGAFTTFSINHNIVLSGSTSLAQANTISYETVGVSGAFTGAGSCAYQYLGIADVAAANAGQGCFGSFVNMSVHGTYQGNRYGIGAQLVVSSAPAAGDTSLQAFVALYGRSAVTANLGGAAGSYTSGKGAIWGANTTCQTTSLATNLAQVFGYECDINAGAAVTQKYGVAVIYQSADTVAGTYDDSAFVVTATPSTPGGATFSPAICFAVGTQGTTFPGTTASTILGVVSQLYPSALSVPKFKYGVDLNPSGTTVITAGGFAFRSPGFTVDPTGNIATSADGTASVSTLLANGTIFTGGSGTTNFPALFVQPSAATAATTWSTAGTAFGVNAASGFTGNFLDFHVNGGASVFSVKAAGNVVLPAGTTAANALQASSNAGTGIFFPNSLQIGFCTNGSQSATLTGAGIFQSQFGITVAGGVLTLPGGSLLTTSAALTNNAGAQAATMNNGPTAGNPTKWFPINDNGTVRNIPAW